MKSFLKMFAASFTALMVFSILPFIFLVGLVASVSAISDEKPVIVKSNSILKIDISQQVVEKLSSSPINYIDFNTLKINAPLTLQKAIQSIYNAAVDDKIKAIMIDARGLNANSQTTIKELRDAIELFKDSGKEVYCYGLTFDNLSYYLGSVADHVYLSPVGSLYWLGLSSDVIYYKSLFDKFGVDVNLIRAGRFKDAGEPFIKSSMSDDNRLQLKSLLGGIWGSLVDEVSKSRDISKDKLNEYADNLTAVSPKSALDVNMVDSLIYFDQFESLVKDKFGESSFVSLPDYAKNTLSIRSVKDGEPTYYSENNIALINAVGEIVDMAGVEGTIGASQLIKEIRGVKKDSTVKAVVLRINSPGGSAVASELIWRELHLLKQEKPLVVTFGDYAASGGYYIAAPADFIFAEPTTITGSIGVFAMLLEIDKAAKNIGINVENVSTNKNATLLSGVYFDKLSPVMQHAFQSTVNDTYNLFKQRVAEGRNLSMDKVEELAQGRVWSGADARANGLVDSMGGLVDAIYYAAEKAGVRDDFIVVEKLNVDNSFNQVMNMLSAKVKAISTPDLGILQRDFDMIKSFDKNSEVKAMLPFIISYN